MKVCINYNKFYSSIVCKFVHVMLYTGVQKIVMFATTLKFHIFVTNLQKLQKTNYFNQNSFFGIKKPSYWLNVVLYVYSLV